MGTFKNQSSIIRHRRPSKILSGHRKGQFLNTINIGSVVTGSRVTSEPKYYNTPGNVSSCRESFSRACSEFRWNSDEISGAIVPIARAERVRHPLSANRAPRAYQGGLGGCDSPPRFISPVCGPGDRRPVASYFTTF